MTKVDTIDSFKLPPELCDTFSLTIDKILPYIGHNDYDMSLTFKDDSDEMVERIFFKGLPILVMGSLNSLLESGVEKQIVSIDHASGRLLVMV